MAAKIKLLQGAMKSLKVNIKDAITTELQLTAQFDQVVANALDIKDSLYDDKGSLRAGTRAWDLDLELYGATVLIDAAQGDLFNTEGLKIESVQLCDVSIIRLKEDEALRLKFKVIMAGVPPEALLHYVEVIKRGIVKIAIDLGSDKTREKAKQQAAQLGLVKAIADPETEEDDEDDAAGEGNGDEPTEDEPPELRGAALASWREINGSKSRRQGKVN